MLDIFKTKLKLKPEYALIATVIALAIAILTLNVSKKQTTELTSTENYIIQTEKKLEKSLAKIDGIRKATVIITISEGIKTVIAEDTKEIDENGKKTKTSSPVLVSGKPIVLGEIYPEIAGVVIICDCTDPMTVRMPVLDVVTTMLNVSCDKVRILTQ